MASHQGMLTLVLMVTLVVLPSSGTMLTVTPSSTNVECFSHSNITLQFFPGNHTLDVNLTITSIQTQYLEIHQQHHKYLYMQSQCWIKVQGHLRCESY